MIKLFGLVVMTRDEHGILWQMYDDARADHVHELRQNIALSSAMFKAMSRADAELSRLREIEAKYNALPKPLARDERGRFAKGAEG